MYTRWWEDSLSVIEEGVQKEVFFELKASQMLALLASIWDGASFQYLMDAGSLDLQAYFDTAYDIKVGVLVPRQA